MASVAFRFEDFVLDGTDRRLSRGDRRVDLNARYLDALTLLVRERGRLVTKDRFLDEVWRGVPVTDEALTQCIRTLRKQLGDDASAPRFIETVPKHGYRFIAPVEPIAGAEVVNVGATGSGEFFPIGIGGTLGAGVAGLVGGLSYGLICAPEPQAAVGAVSLLIVLMSLTVLLALIGGAGVSFGIAAASRIEGGHGGWSILGGAIGGLIVGAVVKLLSHDALQLLLGVSPGDSAGAVEGLILGATVGLAVLLGIGASQPSFQRAVAYAALLGAAGGALISMLGGHLLCGSLDLLVHQVHSSRFSLDQVGAIFGEQGFGPISRLVTAMIEGMTFVACVVGGILRAYRQRPIRLPTETI